MAADHVPYFLVAVTILSTKTTETFTIKEDGDRDFDVRAHLKLEVIQRYCSHRDEACKSNKVNICAIRMKNQVKYHKDFLNDCYLFLSNMCDYPGEEYYLASLTSCEEYLVLRKSNEVTNKTNSIVVAKSKTKGNSSARVSAAAARSGDLRVAYDDHPCPHSCPDMYGPECMIINRQIGGKHLKMYYFLNHCLADAFYCAYEDDIPVPEEAEYMDVRHSPISWSACASSRFIQFSRFAEAASSMAHYGWLAGPYKATHIMEPHQRIPGFG